MANQVWTPLTFDQAIQKYGPIENAAWPNQAQWCELLQVPDEIAAAWINSATNAPTKHIYVNKDMSGPLLQIFQNIIDQKLISALHTFDGCYQIRYRRGEPGVPSWHSYALAIDINAATNPLGSIGDVPKDLAECFIAAGFIWGASFARKDPMHFQFGLR